MAPAHGPRSESAHDLLGLTRRPLDVFFRPRRVAVVGATETPGSVGRTLKENLLATPFGGTVVPVNPKRASVLGQPAYPAVTDVPGSIDLAVVAMTDPTATAEKLKPFAHLAGKPILASWMGGPDVAAGVDVFNRAGVPTFPYPDSAARAFSSMWQLSENLRLLYETPVLDVTASDRPSSQAAASVIVDRARAGGRTLLTEVESKALLAAYGIPTVATRVAADEDEAVAAAEAFGYPVVLKLLSETITQKTDGGGVRLDLPDAAAVRDAVQAIRASVSARAGAQHFAGVTVQPMVRLTDAYELIVGSSLDPQFGPVLLVGAGGQLVEVLQDTALGLPPLTTTLARRLLEQTRIATALQGTRGRPPVDLAALERLLVRFSQLVVEQPWIAKMDINPLLVSHEGIVALDARVVLHPDDRPDAALPRPAIRPYPTQYVAPWTLRDGAPVTIRPIRPEDEPLLVAFHGALSQESVYYRYFHLISLSQRTAHERLRRVCFTDYDRELALVVEHQEAATGERAILAVGRLSKLPGRIEAEFALLISDRYQGQGLGAELLRRLVQIGRAEGLDRITAAILADNVAMQRICRRLGFHLQPVSDGVVRAELALADAGSDDAGAV